MIPIVNSLLSLHDYDRHIFSGLDLRFTFSLSFPFGICLGFLGGILYLYDV
jgi:hypothetical protein